MESPAPGILLIADPFLKDPNFMRTVVFLCEHQDEGSFGFVLNKNYDYTLNELVSGLDDLKLPVFRRTRADGYDPFSASVSR